VVLAALLLYLGSQTATWQTPSESTPPASAGGTSAIGHAGQLVETQPDVWTSPAGLLYLPGSEQGHRLKHVLRHARDDPNRPGQHGVFDQTDLSSVVALIDEAYQQAVRGWRTQTKFDRRRTVHTVDLQRRIGFVGGQAGRQRGHPSARHLRLVLEEREVITAYPVIP
jgi:hypothetical protein